MNIGARHLVDDTHDRRRTIDLHFELRGTIVRQMADVFAEDWNFAAREQISVNEALTLDAGSTSCRVITAGPKTAFEEWRFVNGRRSGRETWWQQDLNTVGPRSTKT